MKLVYTENILVCVCLNVVCRWIFFWKFDVFMLFLPVSGHSTEFFSIVFFIRFSLNWAELQLLIIFFVSGCSKNCSVQLLYISGMFFILTLLLYICIRYVKIVGDRQSAFCLVLPKSCLFFLTTDKNITELQKLVFFILCKRIR